eukprot:260750_1
MSNKSSKENNVEKGDSQDEQTKNNNGHKVFFIGRNCCGQFGLGWMHSNQIREITQCRESRINKVFPSSQHIIYADNGYKNIWGAGRNDYGQCGVGYFRQTVNEYTAIKLKGINIKKICVNSTGSHTFFISDKNELFGCGKNRDGDMGLNEDEQKMDENEGDINEPTLISEVKNVIDAEPGYGSTVLCSNKHHLTVITFWSRTYNLPKDIRYIMTLFVGYKNSVYSTTKKLGSGHPKDQELKNKFGWNEVEIFNDKHIVKIATGLSHTLFLEDTGIIWCCGQEWNGNLGLGEEDDVDVPIKIKYFVENNIMIKDIQCGFAHSLALDVNGNVYCWGYNIYGQCGDGTIENVLTPKVIHFFNDYVVDIIRCGHSHSCVKTKCGKYFLFGDNDHSECISLDSRSKIPSPHRIDVILADKYNIKAIIDVVPGHDNTTIISAI